MPLNNSFSEDKVRIYTPEVNGKKGEQEICIHNTLLSDFDGGRIAPYVSVSVKEGNVDNGKYSLAFQVHNSRKEMGSARCLKLARHQDCSSLLASLVSSAIEFKEDVDVILDARVMEVGSITVFTIDIPDEIIKDGGATLSGSEYGMGRPEKGSESPAVTVREEAPKGMPPVSKETKEPLALPKGIRPHANIKANPLKKGVKRRAFVVKREAEPVVEKIQKPEKVVSNISDQKGTEKHALAEIRSKVSQIKELTKSIEDNLDSASLGFDGIRALLDQI